jgi:hypothetical protein
MVEELDVEFECTVTNKPVMLSVVIGDAQIGASVVRRDGIQLGKTGTIKNRDLGVGGDLVSHNIEIKTLVSDVNDDTNQTSVTYVLEGAQPERMTARRKVENNGDGVLYRAKLVFQKA